MSELHQLSKAYNRSSLIILFSLLAIWFLASFVCSILCREWLDVNFPKIGNAPFGFWMSQQGSIITFILVLVAYKILMNRLDAKHGLVDED